MPGSPTAGGRWKAPSMNRYGFAPSMPEGLYAYAFQSGRQPVIVANPAGDAEFRAFIESSLLAAAGRAEVLEALLRRRYPQALVRPRELAAERTVVWYVYRDGHWIRSDADAQPR
jgi:hypothetical protein